MASPIKLSILCITKAEAFALPFLQEMASLAHLLDAQMVIGADGDHAHRMLACGYGAHVVPCKSKGYLESIHDEVLRFCRGEYVLRLDDDERVSPAMREWLACERYRVDDHWKFPRVHFWGNVFSVLMTPHLYPDCQTRLSVRAKANGRWAMHCGSPYGGGQEAPVVIEHHKFLVRNYAARRTIAEGYDRYAQGYGTGGMAPFSLPEDAYRGGKVRLVAYGRGESVWMPEWEREVTLD